MDIHSRHTVLSNIAITIASALDHYGVDGRAAVEEAGIDYDLVKNPDSRIPFLQCNNLWELATRKSGDLCFGLTVAERFNPTSLNGLGFSWLASSTLKESFQRIVRFQKLINSGSNFGVEMCGENLVILPQYSDARQIHHFSYVLGILAAIVRMSRLTAGEEINPSGVTLVEAMSGCEQRLQNFFKCPVLLGNERNSLSYAASLLDVPIPSANPKVAQINDQIVIDYLKSIDKQSLIAIAQDKIVRMLPSGRPNQLEIAKQLNMSLRNFQRKLKQEGTSFSALVDEVRHELAVNLVQDNSRSIGAISYSLGFSEPANFTRSFKAWTGMSPKAYRQKLNGQ